MTFRLQQILSAILVIDLLCVVGFSESETSPSIADLPDAPETVSLTDKQIRVFEAQAAKQPARTVIRNRLARLYIQKARENGDASYFTRAEKLLTKSLGQEPDNVAALGLQAWVSLSKHDFQAAAQWAEKARSKQPKDSWNYGVLSDAHLEMGDYSQALTYAQKMVDLRPDQGSYSRAAHFRSLYGDPTGAMELWRMAIQAGTPAGEYTAWCKVELGDEFFNQGQWREAEEQYASSLQSFSSYHRGLAGLAKVREAQQQWAEAAGLYQKAIDVVPYPQYVSALGDVYWEMGQTEKAEQQYILIEHIAHLDRLNQVLYNRDLALFYADHGRNLEEAQRLARKELELRKDIYTYDVLAWVAYRNRRYPEAQEAVKNALKLGTKNARILFHAGMISLAAGHRKEARTFLKQALTINPYFHPFQRKTAQEALEELRPAKNGTGGPAVR